jgi:hypothetical protein
MRDCPVPCCHCGKLNRKSLGLRCRSVCERAPTAPVMRRIGFAGFLSKLEDHCAPRSLPDLSFPVLPKRAQSRFECCHLLPSGGPSVTGPFPAMQQTGKEHVGKGSEPPNLPFPTMSSELGSDRHSRAIDHSLACYWAGRLPPRSGFGGAAPLRGSLNNSEVGSQLPATSQPMVRPPSTNRT